MTGWLLPLAAAAFWAGILASEGPARSWPPPGLLLAGAGLLGAAAWLAPAPARAPGPLEHAGLAGREDRPALDALDRGALGPARAPPAGAALVAITAVAALGAGWAGLRSAPPPNPWWTSPPPGPVDVVASLRTDPQEGPFGWTALAGAQQVTTAAGVRLRPGGTLLLEGTGPPPDAERWDRVLVRGRVATGDAGTAAFVARRGAHALLRVAEIRRLGPAANPGLRAVQAVRGALREGVRALFPPREAGLLLGLALGDTSSLDPGVEEDFRATGLTHLVAVSGQNVAMVLAPVLGLAMLLRLPAAARFWAGSGVVLAFALLTGLEPSVVRAGVMAVLTLAGMLWGRPRSPGSVLGAAVLVLLVADPTLVRSVGFQLSVAATAGLLALAAPLASRLGFLPRPVALAVATTVAAQAGVGPLLLYHFHQVPLVGLPANLLAFPAVAPAMLLGLAAAAIGHVAGPLAGLPAAPAFLSLRYLETVADRLAAFPAPSVTSLSGGPATLIGGIAAVAAVAWWLRSGRPLPRRTAVAAALVVPVFVWSTALRAGPPAGLVVTFFDVGQGDAALVSTPEGAHVLIDGGPDPGLVATKLAALGVRRLDVVVATHPHADHVEGLPRVLARFPVGLVIEPGCDEPSPSYESFLAALEDEGVPVRHPRSGEVLTVGELRLEVLSPDRCYAGTDSDPNNDSLVLMVRYLEDTVLFPGDAEEPAQEALLEEGVSLRAEVLKVPHHGGATSVEEFFVAVGPEVAVVSVGPNDYGHPVPSIIDRLALIGALVLRTDRAGDVVVRFGPGGPSVQSAAG